jgi:hypothetical protein
MCLASLLRPVKKITRCGARAREKVALSVLRDVMAVVEREELVLVGGG